MKRKPRLFVPHGYEGYAAPYVDTLFDLTHQPFGCDVVLLPGGKDIPPEWYGEKIGRYTDHPSRRDVYEKNLFDYCLKTEKKFLGICRGAQMLCAMAGGKLVQDANGHALGYHNYHKVVTSTGDELLLNTLHHQMMLPGNIEHEVLAWCPEARSNRYLNGENQEIQVEKELEIAYFPSVRGLAIQCHPEYGIDRESKEMKYLFNLIETRLL